MNLKLKYLFALPIGDFNRGKEKQSEAAMKELAQRIYGRCRHIASGPMEDSITLLASASPSAHPTIECFKSVFGSKTKIVVNELYWTGPGMMSTPSAVHRDLSRRFGIVVMITHPDVVARVPKLICRENNIQFSEHSFKEGEASFIDTENKIFNVLNIKARALV